MRALLIAAVFCVGAGGASELVDQVVATVGSSPILKSDLDLARIVRLTPVSGLKPAEACRAIFEGRLRLEIQYRDLEASGIVYRLKVDREAVVRELERRNGGQAKLQSELEAAGLSLQDVRELAVRVAAVNAYVNQRLRPRVRVSLQELRTAYQESLVLEIASRGAAPPPFDEVREQLHTLLVEKKLNAEIRTWIRDARSRLQVTILVSPEMLFSAGECSPLSVLTPPESQPQAAGEDEAGDH